MNLLTVQPLQDQGNISDVAPATSTPPLTVASSATQQPISIQQPQEQHLDYIKNSPDQPNSQSVVAPLPDDVKATMVSKLTSARQQFPGQDDQILQQFIQQNKDKYPVQIGKLEKTINYGQDTKGDSNSSLALYNNPMGLKDPATGQFKRFSDPTTGFQAGLKDLEGKISGNSRTGTSTTSTLLDLSKAWAGTGSNNVTSWAQSIAKMLGVSVDTPIGQIDPTQLASAVAKHETGYTPTTSYDPSSVLDELIKQNQPTTPTSPIAQPSATWDSGGILTGSNGLIHNINNDFQNIQQSENQNIANQQSGKEGPVSGLLQTLGAGAQGINSVIGEGAKAIFRGAVPQEVQQEISNIGQSKIVQQAEQPAKGYLSQLATQHPIGMANATAGLNLGLLGASLYGGDIAGESITDTAQTTAENADTWSKIQPKLSPTELAQSAKAGGVSNSGIFYSQVPTDSDQSMISAARPYVTTTNDPIEQISNMQQGIADKATALRSGLADTGATFTKSQLQGAFNQIDDDPNLISDPVLQKKAALLQAKALEFAGNGGGLDDLQNVNTKLDQYIAKYYPNLYNSDALTPLRQAVSETRNAIKDLIDSRLSEGNIPNAGNYRQLLQEQSSLYDAIDNVASKVPKLGSPTGLIGKGLKLAGKVVTTGLGLTAGGELAKKLGIIP